MLHIVVHLVRTSCMIAVCTGKLALQRFNTGGQERRACAGDHLGHHRQLVQAQHSTSSCSNFPSSTSIISTCLVYRLQSRLSALYTLVSISLPDSADM
jgi:hypothetical protein